MTRPEPSEDAEPAAPPWKWIRVLQVVLVLHAIYYLPVTGFLAWAIPQVTTMMSTDPLRAAQVVIGIIGIIVAAVVGCGVPFLVFTALRLGQDLIRARTMFRACGVVVGIHLLGSLVLLANSSVHSLGVLALAGGCPVFVLSAVFIRCSQTVPWNDSRRHTATRIRA
jgi:hypothetical protein